MDVFLVVALIAFALLAAELLLPTGGALAAVGTVGLVVSGILALDSDSSVGDYVGPALITLGVLSAASFYFVARKVIAAQRRQSVRGGSDLVGSSAEARSSIDPEGQVWTEGALWGARLADDGAPVRVGDRVTIEAIEGLTLVVRRQSPTAPSHNEGGS